MGYCEVILVAPGGSHEFAGGALHVPIRSRRIVAAAILYLGTRADMSACRGKTGNDGK